MFKPSKIFLFFAMLISALLTALGILAEGYTSSLAISPALMTIFFIVSYVNKIKEAAAGKLNE